MKIILFGKPESAARQRSFTRNGITRNYNPKANERMSCSQYIQEEVREAGWLPIYDVYHVCFTFYFEIPKSLSTAKRNMLLWFPEYDKKPDFDNLCKFYMDAANGIIWKDDCQIVNAPVRKFWAEKSMVVIDVVGEVNRVDHECERILKLFSPAEFDELIADLRALGDCYDSPGCETYGHIENAAEAALLVSKLAKKYADKLMRIKKAVK